MSTLVDFYSRRVSALSGEILSLRKKNRTYIALELITFCTALLAGIFWCLRGMPVALLSVALAFLAAYVAVRRIDVRNGEKTERLRRLRLVYEKELKYMRGDFSCFGDGSRYADPGHAFTYDMDVFGHDSLFNRMNRTVTTGGSDMLASWLGSLPADRDSIARRREAIAELAGMEEWRTEFLAMGQRLAADGKGLCGETDSSAILGVISDVRGMEIAPKAGKRGALVAAYTAVAGFIAAILLAVFTSVPSSVPVLWGVLQLFVVLAVTLRPLRKISRAVEKLHSQLNVYIMLIRHVAGAEFGSRELKELQDRLSDDDACALMSFGQLSGILKSLDRRGNVLGLILFNMFALSDFFLVRRFLKWQRLYMERISEWVGCVSRADALVSMAVFRYNEPEAVDAEVTDAPGVTYAAKGLYHPFLGVKAVRNDFTVEDGSYYIVTGANMAGKSTFLRSVGINYILAMNGMPVFAESLRVSVFNLFSSMRTTDDLSRGISYFNAELLRLRQLIESCKHAGRTLIILDEILKGTNSLDKLNGSRLFLQEISRLPVSGLIATHDLELSKMEETAPSRFHNWCFEIELADNVTYTYKITPGVARNQNATFLLKRIIGEISGS